MSTEKSNDESPKEKPPDNAEQSARFIEKAKELGVDQSGELFQGAIKKIIPPRGGAPENK